MKKKLKILAASDLQGQKSIAEKLAKKAKKNKVDLVVLAGDINEAGHGDSRMLEPFVQAGQKVIFVPGNWDTSKEHKEMKGDGRSIDGAYVNYEGVGIIGMGDEDWKMELDDEDFRKVEYNFKKMKTKKNILVSHLHARGTKAEFSGIEGDEVVRRAVEKFKPDILISGHIHEAEGLEDKIGKTNVFHVGPKGKVLEI
jgi:Icc-related predicted phosphoesterase